MQIEQTSDLRPDTMNPALPALVQLAAGLAGRKVEAVVQLADFLVGPAGTGRMNSTLNNDGSPLQLSLTLAGERTHLPVRLIADPAGGIEDRKKRFERAENVAREVAISHGPEMEPLCHSMVRMMLPAGEAAQMTLPGAGVWIAVDLSGRGLALYATAKWESAEKRWARAGRWLKAILPHGSEEGDVLDRLSQGTVLVSVGVEGAKAANATVKLYWRIEGSAPLKSLGIPLMAHPSVSEFLSTVLEDRRIPRKSILASVGFHAGSGRLNSVKLDICGHCVERTPSDWTGVLERWAASNNVAPLPLDYSVLLEAAELAFIGMGLNAGAQPRLNLYLKERTGARGFALATPI